MATKSPVSVAETQTLLEDAFTALNEKWQSVNEELRELNCPVSAYLDITPDDLYGSPFQHYIAWAKVYAQKGYGQEWQVTFKRHHEEVCEEATPMWAATAEQRLSMLDHVDDLRQQMLIASRRFAKCVNEKLGEKVEN
jgi:hypothetical protein